MEDYGLNRNAFINKNCSPSVIQNIVKGRGNEMKFKP